MATLTTTSSGGAVAAGATLTVTAGGNAVNWTVAGTEVVSSGGKDSGAKVGSGGVIIVSSGGSIVNETISIGGREVVATGGTASGSVIAGGTLELQVGALGVTTSNTAGVAPTFTFTAAGGTVLIDSGLTYGQIAVGANQSYVVSSGAHVQSDTVLAGGTITVLAGGVATADTISAGGREIVTSAGSATAIKMAGGTLELQAGEIGVVVPNGGATAATVGFGAAGGTIQLDSGITFSGIAVATSQTYVVTSGARISGDSISGGTVVLAGGTAANDVISAGGREVVGSGGSVTGASIAGGTLEIQAGAIGVVGPNGAGTAATFGFTAAGGTVQLDGGVVANKIAVGSGQTYVASSGGQITSGVVSAGGAIVLSGGTATNDVILIGGRESVSLGGVATGTVLSSGGGQNVLSGGVASGTTVINGANQNVSAGGTTFATVLSQGAENVSSGGVAVGTQVNNGAEFIASGATASGSVIGNGGLVQVAAGGQLAGVTTISGGGRAVLNGTAGSGSLNLVGSGGTVTVSGLAMPSNTISGFVTGDFLDLASVAAGSITGVTRTADAVTITAGGSAYTLNVAGVGAEGYKLVADGNGGTFYEVCFAAGTRIATPGADAGAEVEVERLAVGDLVSTLDGPRPVTWVGRRSVDVARLADPDSGRLVRIRAGAFADAVPHRDLLVTQEHCVFVECGGIGDGRLIPARMLVNGRSVVIERGIAAYTFYHVELAEHAILLAEGLTTESYLDTGNRANFANSAVTAMRPSLRADAAHKSWAEHAAAPLCVDRAVVEPVWAMLDARARRLGVAATTAPLALLADPALHLATEQGVEIEPARSASGRYVFAVPAGAGGLRLLSRTARPSQTVGPFVDDRRALGVLVGEVAVWHGRRRRVVSPHLAAAELAGWFGVEDAPHRWTDGRAALPLALSDGPMLDGPMLVEVEVVTAGPYLATGDAAANAAHHAAGGSRRG